MTNFAELGLTPSTLTAITHMGFTTATPVQAQAIPLLMNGRDIVAQARTGTGKTAAFGIPIIEHIGKHPRDGVLALVLVPTRELALQVSEELAKIAKGTPIAIVPVYGGVGFGDQTHGLRKPGTPKIVVATPGRLLDHLNRRTLTLDAVRHLVLDEADRMLDMGFLPDVERILKGVPKERQTGLFSATLPEPIKRLCQKFQHNPATVRVETGPASTPLTEQFRIDVTVSQKGPALMALLTKENPTQAIVFTRTKHLARRLARTLAHSGQEAVALQGNMTQGQRERAMEQFREGDAKILVATDIASRGLDVPDVSHVINYDLPKEPDAYVHRIGRTGRMGKTGRAFSFVQPDQGRDLRDVEIAAGIKLTPYDVGPLPKEEPKNTTGDKNVAGRAYQERRHGGGGNQPQRQGGQRNNQDRRPRQYNQMERFQRGGGTRGQQGSYKDRRPPREGGYGGGQPRRAEASFAPGSDQERW